MKLNSVFRIFILILVVLNFHFMTTKFNSFDGYGFIFFISISIFVSGVVLPQEILNILGIRKVFNFKKFNWTRLLFLIPALVELLNATMYSDIRTNWYGLDMHHLSALSFVLLIFLYRDNYILINNRIIRIHVSGGLTDSTKIKWIDVIRIDFKDNLVMVESDTKKIEIGFEKIRKRQLPIILNMIEQKYNKHRAQHMV